MDSISYLELDRQITPAIENAEVNTLVFDLAKLDCISSAGIRSVFRARKALAARGGRVLVVNPQAQSVTAIHGIASQAQQRITVG